MTTTPPAHLHLTTAETRDTVRMEMRGPLDYDSADRLLAAATAKIAELPHLADLYLHCAGLDDIDSMGLSVLLMIHRRTSEAGVRLHLVDRPPRLDRLLTVTGTLAHFTAPGDGAENSGAGTRNAPAESGERRTGSPTGPDGTN
ncbi:STAS domain-containing protein [Streptomyces sp. NPDC049040]|uniref:STAS domain-containing protein n=1 Tax=Streptomyces sp. NPDC049040 TaxID=3365593 RepID=UPI00371F01E7